MSHLRNIVTDPRGHRCVVDHRFSDGGMKKYSGRVLVLSPESESSVAVRPAVVALSRCAPRSIALTE